MPHSPFTRYFGLAIVAAYALALLWPDERAYVWGMYALIALPLVIGIFTWSAVGGAPPFDDNAFHRTLPPGDDYAFRKVIMIHVMVLAGIALAVVAYCWVFNFGWQAMTYGIALLTIPVWAWMATCGIATSLATTRQQGKTWGYLAIFAVPAFSWTWLYWMRLGFDPDNPYRSNDFYFTSLRTMALTAAVLYPLIWWLVAAKRRRGLGFAFGIATSALMPWLYIYGDFVEAPVREQQELPKDSHVTITRNATLPAEGKWLPLDQLLTIDGLHEGEFITTYLQVERPTPERGDFLNTWAIPQDPAETGFEPKRSRIMAGRFLNGNIAWGEQAVWNHLLEQVPNHGTFTYWNQDLKAPTRLALLRPGESWALGPRKIDANSLRFYQERLREPDLVSAVWKSSFGAVFRWKKLADVDAARGGDCRLPEGGIIRVKPLVQEDSHHLIVFRHFYPSTRSDGPWFEPQRTSIGWDQPWVIAVDESGQHSFALTPLTWTNSTGRQRVMLGDWYDWIFEAGEAKSREQVARMEMLRHCRLHIFWPHGAGQLPQEIPPPH